LVTKTPPDEMPGELDYLVSRMRERQLIPVAGPDVRVVNAVLVAEA
jgi:hypothetical protein